MLIETVQQETVKAVTNAGVENVWINPPRKTELPFVKLSIQAVPTQYKLDLWGEEIDLEFTILTQSEYHDNAENYAIMDKVLKGIKALEILDRAILFKVTDMYVTTNENDVEVGTLRVTLKIY